MSTQEKTTTDGTTAGRSRFTYHGEEDGDPGEGGVIAARPPASRNGSASARSTPPGTVPGIPGPAEPLLDISELARTVGMRYRHRIDFPADTIPGVETSAPTVGEIRLTNTGAVLLLRGEVTATLRLECSRCLTLTDEPVEATIEEEFALVASNAAYKQDEVHAVDEDTPAAVIDKNILNVADLLRQELLLSAPFQPLCREDCPGIAHESYLGPDVVLAEVSDVLPPVAVENPLRRLAELLEEKRRREGTTTQES